MWHVSSRSGVATLRTAIHLLLTYLLTSRTSLPSFSPLYSQPFPSTYFPPPLKTIWRNAIAHPAGPGGAGPPSVFLCNSQPRICKSVKSFTHVHKTSMRSPSWQRCNKTFLCLISRCPNFHCTGKLFLKFFWPGTRR